MKNELFTFGIISYNNYMYIKEAVDSVLEQDYPAVQLIISNDGSRDFNKEELEAYIESKKKDNIKSVLINDNETNVGTVKNVNFVAKNAQGKYFMIMAADDALYDTGVLSKFVDEFEKRGDDVALLSGKIAMCGETLDDVKDYEPQQNRIEILKSGDNNKIFSVLTYDSFIPTTSTCLRMDVLRDTGFYDEDYFIIEDASKYIQLAREGYKFGWIDNFVGARHRDGGISHGNSRNKSESYRRYRFDEIVLYTKEILPYVDRIFPDDMKHMEWKWNYIEGNYYKNFIRAEDGTLDYRPYDREICEPRIQELMKQWKKQRVRGVLSKVKNRIQDVAVTVSLKKVFKDIVIILMGILATGLLEVFVASGLIMVLGSQSLSSICILGIYLLLVLLLLANFMLIGIRLVWDCYLIIRRIKK